MNWIKLNQVSALNTSKNRGKLEILTEDKQKKSISNIKKHSDSFNFYHDKIPYIFEGVSPSIRVSKLVLDDAYLIMFPRSEGVIVTSNHFLIQESIKSLRISERNPYLKRDKNEIHLNYNAEEVKYIDTCALCFDCASNNYYHLLSLYYPLLLLANKHDKNQKLVVPKLKDYLQEYKTGVQFNVFDELLSTLKLVNSEKVEFILDLLTTKS